MAYSFNEISKAVKGIVNDSNKIHINNDFILRKFNTKFQVINATYYNKKDFTNALDKVRKLITKENHLYVSVGTVDANLFKTIIIYIQYEKF